MNISALHMSNTDNFIMYMYLIYIESILWAGGSLTY